MHFKIKRDVLLKSLNFVQGVVEKYSSDTIKCASLLKDKKNYQL